MRKIFNNIGIHDYDKIADYILSFLPQTNTFCFYGNLGAGKTTIIKGICKRLAVTDNVSSPTYPIINEYTTANGDTVYHLDLYRLQSTDEAKQAGVEEVLFSDKTCLIEWPDNFEDLLPVPHVKIFIGKLDADKRTVEIELST